VKRDRRIVEKRSEKRNRGIRRGEREREERIRGV